MRLIAALFCCILLAFLSACKRMPNDGIPFYLKVDSVALTTSLAQGDNTQNVTDVWVEAGSTNIGAYELPANFPVLEENEVRMVLSAGIMQNGLYTWRVIYPFYAADTFTLTAQRDGRYEHVAQFKYKPATQFKLIENFENQNGFSGLVLTGDSVKYGTVCGQISVNTTDTSKVAALTNYIDLPEGSEIWIEVDYKSTVPFYVGFYGLSGGQTVRYDAALISSSAEWTKAYIEIGTGVSGVRAETYSIYFEAVKPTALNSGDLFIDNVKLVHY